MSYWERTGQSDDWFTPSYIFEAMGVVFDLDVAGNEKAQVPAQRMLTDGGLSQEWEGFVWMNPPFGGRNALQPWLEKFVAHGNGVALTPDRTSAPWWQYAVSTCDALFCIKGKVQFIRPDGTLGKSPSTGTNLFAIGSRGVGALRKAYMANLGRLLIPERLLD